MLDLWWFTLKKWSLLISGIHRRKHMNFMSNHHKEDSNYRLKYYLLKKQWVWHTKAKKETVQFIYYFNDILFLLVEYCFADVGEGLSMKSWMAKGLLPPKP